MSYRLLSKRKSNNIKQGWHDYFLKGRVVDGGGGHEECTPPVKLFSFLCNNNRLRKSFLGLMPPPREFMDSPLQCWNSSLNFMVWRVILCSSFGRWHWDFRRFGLQSSSHPWVHTSPPSGNACAKGLTHTLPVTRHEQSVDKWICCGVKRS